jgi:hypothetical protein
MTREFKKGFFYGLILSLMFWSGVIYLIAVLSERVAVL